MKIAIISSVYEQTPPLRYGGIERVLDFLVKGLKTSRMLKLFIRKKHADISMNITLTSCIIMWIFQLV